jgi:hypothetical protein
LTALAVLFFCILAVLSFDAMDMAGKHDTDVLKGGDVSIHKYRLDRFGAHMDHEEYVPPAVVQIMETPFGVQMSGKAKEVRWALLTEIKIEE